MTRPVLYSFNSFPAFFEEWLKWQRKRDSKYSIRWLAVRLKLKSHAHLTRIAKGQKPPMESLLIFISSSMQLSIDEFSYLRALAALTRVKSTDELAFLTDRIEGLKKSIPDILIDLDRFELIAHWHHVAIFELISLANFNSDPKWIAERLMNTVSEETVQDSLLRLERLGFIEKTMSGAYKKNVFEFNTTDKIPSSTIRNYHDELLEKSREALHGIPTDQRLFYSRIMTLDSNKLDEAAQLLTEFRSRFSKLLEGGYSDTVYHLGLQLIPLSTTIPK